jgi:shikimate kinase
VNIILCGLPKSGKTTFGKRIAEKSGLNFIDTDQLIEKFHLEQTGELFSCREIFLHHGERHFRFLEKIQIQSLSSTNKSIIAVGGGSILDPANRKILASIGCCVYLKTSPELIWHRMQSIDIPAYLQSGRALVASEEAWNELTRLRIPLYESLADIIIEL